MKILTHLPQILLVASLPLLVPTLAHAELPAGVTYKRLAAQTVVLSDGALNDIDIHIVSIDRSRSDYELRIIGVEADDDPGHVLLTPLRDMVPSSTIVAINGYEWAFAGPGSVWDYHHPVRPNSTLFLHNEMIRDCFSAKDAEEEAAAGCYNDKNILGISGGMDLKLFSSQSFGAQVNSAYHKYAIGSDYFLLLNGECLAYGAPQGDDSRTAIAFNDDTVFFLSTDMITGWLDDGLDNAKNGDLCQIMLDLGATDGFVLDGGTAAGMVVDGEQVNPLQGVLSAWLDFYYGTPNRSIATAIALVKKAPDPGPDPQGSCPSGDGLYCGDSVGLDEGVLYSCIDGVYEEVMMCADGCTTATPGENDYCGSGESCPSGDGLYCGGPVGLDADVLYTCSDGVFTENQTCPDGCEVAPPGENDTCVGAPCDCASGECCDGCHFRSSSHVCDPGVDKSYGCIGSGCGADVSVSVRDRLCSGFSAGCDGGYSAWSPAELFAACASDEECTEGSQSCSASQACTQCTNSYEVTDHACSDFTSATGLNNEIFEVCGSVDEQTGYMTVRARKYDGTTFGDRPYQVRVSPPGDPACGPDTWIYYKSDESPSGKGTDELVFTFQSVWEEDQTTKGYCVTASTQNGDPDYDPNSDEQTSWWWSDKLTLTKTCVP